MDQSGKEVQSPKKSSILSVKSITKIRAWDVQTPYQQENMAQMLRESDNYQLDILELSEARWIGSRRICSDGRTLLYSGYESQHASGVGMVLSNNATKSLIG